MQLFAKKSQHTRESVVGRLRSVTAPRAVSTAPRVVSTAPRADVTDSEAAQRPLVSAAPEVVKPLGKLAFVAVAIVVAGAWLNRPHENVQARTVTPGVGFPAPSSSAFVSQASSHVVVDVEGDVRHPGLVTLPAGSRIAEALKAAGGISRKIPVGSVNLAELVTDGQLIIVGEPTGQAGGASDPTIHLNTATASDLDALPGVGPVLAARIVAWRTEHSSFHSIDELQEVPGIGPKVFANLKSLVRI